MANLKKTTNSLYNVYNCNINVFPKRCPPAVGHFLTLLTMGNQYLLLQRVHECVSCFTACSEASKRSYILFENLDRSYIVWTGWRISCWQRFGGLLSRCQISCHELSGGERVSANVLILQLQYFRPFYSAFLWITI